MLRKIIVGLALVGALAFGALDRADAQSGPFCSKFDGGNQDGWGPCPAGPNISVTTSNNQSIGGAGDSYLLLTDQSGASAACTKDPKYMGDWAGRMSGCGQFCFDFKVFHAGYPPAPVTPSFTIWSGSLSATFVANFTVTASDPWRQQICAPINLIQAGQNLPSGGSGSWRIGGSNAFNANWNTIIQNVTQVQLPIDFTNQPSEIAGYDNMCMSPGGCDNPPPVVTGCLADMKAEVKCNPDGTYTLTLSGAGFSGNDIALTSQTPGVTVSPPQQPYAATTTWTLVGATPGQTVKLTANATQTGGGSVPGTDLCCDGEITVTMPTCPIDLKVAKTITSQAPDLAFKLNVTNNGAQPVTLPPNSIQVTENVPAGLTVHSIGPTPWVCTPSAPPAVAGAAAIVCTYSLGVTLAAGQALVPAINVTALAGTSPPGPWTNCATVGLTSTAGVSDSDPANNTDCVKVEQPVDLAITKTGGTSPAPDVNAYAFHLTVTNVSAGFNGTNAITVTDTVPAGMTFNSAAGPNWTCGTLPASAGSTITCTYTGTGPTAPNQSLGTINISASALGSSPYPPFTNCATVGIASGAPVHDINASNDTACVTVVKPPMPCPRPMTAGALVGQCICPAGTVQKGRECVRPTACAPPLVPGPVAGRCICPQGTVQKGRECVHPPACRPPMIAGPAPGACVCPQGMVQKGRQCVPAVECRAPMIRNPAGTACVCPAGTVQRGRTCAPPTVCNPPARLNRSGACECPANMVARGNSCVPRELRPSDVIRGAPGSTPGGPSRGSPEAPGRR